MGRRCVKEVCEGMWGGGVGRCGEEVWGGMWEVCVEEVWGDVGRFGEVVVCEGTYVWRCGEVYVCQRRCEGGVECGKVWEGGVEV